MSRILLTGSEGFIGQHLIRELRCRGHHVVTTDRHRQGVDQLRRDLRHGIDDILRDYRPDLVVHLAAHVGRLFGEDDMAACIADNAQATALLAAECGRRRIRMAYASTSEVYGDRGNHDCRETDPLDVLPHNLYGLSKRWGEEACRLYTDDPIIFRLSMPYGPGVRPGRGRRALDTMLWQAHHGLPITVHRGAERSWCWVGDTVRGIAMVVDRGEGGAWNIGRDDDPVSMLRLAEFCCDLTGRDPGDLITLVDPPAMQTVVKRLSTEKLARIGWHPTVELDEGVPIVLDWVRRFDQDGNPKHEEMAA